MTMLLLLLAISFLSDDTLVLLEPIARRIVGLNIEKEIVALVLFVTVKKGDFRFSAIISDSLLQN